MYKLIRLFGLSLLLCLMASCAVASSARAASAMAQAVGTIAFTVSMPQPSNHLYHVAMHGAGLPGEMQDLKMPVWTPGYYGVLDYAGNVRNFQAQDGAGQALAWAKTSPNTWRVAPGKNGAMEVSYEVLAARAFVANSFLDETRGYIMPASLFLYPAGQINHPVLVSIEPNPQWSTIATGMDAVAPERPSTYAPADFDTLYDSPILMGNLETLPAFEIRGVRHEFIGYNLGNFDRAEFIQNLKATVAAGIDIIGEVPYKHYTFLAIGPGQGGIEHLNSTSFGFNGNGMGNRNGRNQMLRFLAHEYFHNFNVKRIRPIALGPFDYDKANLTNMLWVSEGFTVYYEYLMLARAGLATARETFDSFQANMAAYENNTGHLFQSVTQSSYDTWNQGPFGRRGQGLVKTVSYYDKGPVLGLLLDFAIRHATGNRKSLDTAMQVLYQRYYKGLKRGWTDEEFRAVCEEVAGISLAECFDYASTTKDIDYAKYLSYAGLELEAPRELAPADFRGVAEDVDGKLVITALGTDSAARRAGLAVGDEIRAVDGTKMTAAGFTQALAAHHPGDTLRLAVATGGSEKAVSVVLEHKLERSWRIQGIANPDAQQTALVRSWLGIH